MQIKTYNIVHKTHGYIMRYDLANGGGGGVGVGKVEVHRKWFSLIKDGYLCAKTPLQYYYVYTRAVLRQPVAKKVRGIILYCTQIDGIRTETIM